LLLLNQYVSSIPYVDLDVVQEVLYLLLLQFPHFDKRFEMGCLEVDLMCITFDFYIFRDNPFTIDHVFIWFSIEVGFVCRSCKLLVMINTLVSSANHKSLESTFMLRSRSLK